MEEIGFLDFLNAPRPRGLSSSFPDAQALRSSFPEIPAASRSLPIMAGSIQNLRVSPVVAHRRLRRRRFRSHREVPHREQLAQTAAHSFVFADNRQAMHLRLNADIRNLIFGVNGPIPHHRIPFFVSEPIACCSWLLPLNWICYKTMSQFVQESKVALICIPAFALLLITITPKHMARVQVYSHLIVDVTAPFHDCHLSAVLALLFALFCRKLVSYGRPSPRSHLAFFLVSFLSVFLWRQTKPGWTLLTDFVNCNWFYSWNEQLRYVTVIVSAAP